MFEAICTHSPNETEKRKLGLKRIIDMAMELKTEMNKLPYNYRFNWDTPIDGKFDSTHMDCSTSVPELEDDLRSLAWTTIFPTVYKEIEGWQRWM